RFASAAVFLNSCSWVCPPEEFFLTVKLLGCHNCPPQKCSTGIKSQPLISGDRFGFQCVGLPCSLSCCCSETRLRAGKRAYSRLLPFHLCVKLPPGVSSILPLPQPE